MGFPLLKHRSCALSRSTRCATHSEDRVNTVAPILSSRVDLGDARLQPSLSFWTMYCSAHVMPVSCPGQLSATLVAQVGDRPAPVPSRGPGRRTTREASYRRPRLRGPLRCVARVARQRPDVIPWRIAVRGDVSASARTSCCPDSTGCPAGLASHLNSHRSRRSTTAPASLRSPTSGSMTRGCHAPGDIAIVCSAARRSACCHAATGLEPAQVQRHPHRSLHASTGLSKRPACAAPRVRLLRPLAAPTTRRKVLSLSSHPTMLHLDPRGASVGATRPSSPRVPPASMTSLQCLREALRSADVVWDREPRRVTAPAPRGPDRPCRCRHLPGTVTHRAGFNLTSPPSLAGSRCYRSVPCDVSVCRTRALSPAPRAVSHRPRGSCLNHNLCSTTRAAHAEGCGLQHVSCCRTRRGI